MPLYEFLCAECGRTAEVLMCTTQWSIMDCSECGGESTMKRLPSAPAVHFKGAGFYVNDYAKPEKKDASNDES